jgi:hypothetical protein
MSVSRTEGDRTTPPQAFRQFALPMPSVSAHPARYTVGSSTGKGVAMEPNAGSPPGPSVDPLMQGTLFHRDPVGVLSRCQARFGDVFTLSMPASPRSVVGADRDWHRMRARR